MRLLPALTLAVMLSATAAEAGPRKFYLTKGTYDGSEARTACTEKKKFHFASMWEILDVTGLQYDLKVGLTKGDSGNGPPSGFDLYGWIRTGADASGDGAAGTANCSGWTVNSGAYGTIVTLSPSWGTFPTAGFGPWAPGVASCNSELHVWCVSDK